MWLTWRWYARSRHSTGTGLAAEAALGAVGATGHVTAADLSPAMIEKARRRFGNALNVSLAVEDGQARRFRTKVSTR